MFELKKYQIKKAFGTYREGQLVAFSGADAEKYKDFIGVCETVAKTGPEEMSAVKKVKKGRK